MLVERLIEAAGWAAALLILASYLLVSTGRLAARSVAFQAMNVAGAAGFVLNIAWAAIGLASLWSLRRASPSPGGRGKGPAA